MPSVLPPPTPNARTLSLGTWLVVGASRGIGLAIAELLSNRGCDVRTTHCHTPPPQGLPSYHLDINSDASIEQFTQHLMQDVTSLSGVINCVGVLHDEALHLRPEKSLKQVSRLSLQQAANTNAIGHIMLIQALEPLLKPVPDFVCVSLSAKVGSIEDNRLGGWHSYRASKAMLNMLMRNVAIEFSRKYPQSIVATIHPGLTATKLSEPFYAKSPLKVHEASETAVNIINLISELDNNGSGGFYTYARENLPF